MSEQLGFLNNENLQFILFGGKGGVGKTTSSAASAIYLARTRPNKKILVFSTDPAHSLSDSFDQQIGDKVTQIKGFDNLFAFEMDAKRIYDDYNRRHYLEFLEIADRATVFFDTQDLTSMLSVNMPGIDEVMALKKIIDFIKSEEYNLIIMDTAPTGHTLTLLGLMYQMEDRIDVMIRSQERYQYVRKSLSGRYTKDDIDKFLDEQREDIRRVRAVLTDPEKTEFVAVTIPEAMGMYETERLLKALREYRVPVKNVIINRISQDMNTNCDFCMLGRKKQEECIEESKKKFDRCNIIRMPLFSHEIRGIASLSEYADVLSNNGYRHGADYPSKRPMEIAVISPRSEMPDLLKKELRFILFGGKGGVGKTTSATATALHIAKTMPDKKILILSTDPAHSLSDSFDQQVGSEITQIKGSLFAFEINPEEEFERLKRDYREEIDKVFEGGAFGGDGAGKLDMTFDRRTMKELLDQAPPGLDEMMALTKITDFVAEKKYNLIIIDTAPTGHLIRLLQTPDLLSEWITVLVRIQRKYRGIVNLYSVMRLMLETKKRITDTQKILNNPKKTEFVTVTIPEAMSVSETGRLLTELKNLKIPSKHVIINWVIPPTECNFCASKREEQQNYIKEINERFPEYAVTEMPLFPYEIRGLDGLTNFAETMYGKRYVSSYT